MRGSKGAAEGRWGLWLEHLSRWAAIRGRGGCWGEAELGFGGASFDGDVGGPWLPWSGLCVAGRQHKGIVPFVVGTTGRTHLVLRRNLLTAQAPQILYQGPFVRHDGVATPGPGTRACGSQSRAGRH